MLTPFITLAIIPGLCPIDDIIIWLLFPSIGIWLIRRFKWCKKSCKCDCHGKKTTDDGDRPGFGIVDKDGNQHSYSLPYYKDKE